MVNEILVEYLKKGLVKGYSLSNLRKALVNQKYNKKDIKEAIKYINTRKKAIKEKGNDMIQKEKGNDMIQKEIGNDMIQKEIRELRKTLTDEEFKQKRNFYLEWLVSLLILTISFAFSANQISKVQLDYLNVTFLGTMSFWLWNITIITICILILFAMLFIRFVYLFKKNKKELIKKLLRIRKHRKGQIYILAALILSAIIFSLLSEINVLKKEEVDDNFVELSQNYKIESANFVNSLLSKGQSIPDSFSDFTILFSAYSRAQNPNFGLIYAFNYEDALYVGNYLDQAVVVDCSGCTATYLNGCFNEVEKCLIQEGSCLDVVNKEVIAGCTAQMSDSSITEVAITIDGIGYVFEITPKQPEIIIVSREYIGELSKVYMDGEFKKEKSGTGIFFTDPEIGGSCGDYKRRNGCEKDPHCCWEQTGISGWEGECIEGECG